MEREGKCKGEQKGEWKAIGEGKRKGQGKMKGNGNRKTNYKGKRKLNNYVDVQLTFCWKCLIVALF